MGKERTLKKIKKQRRLYAFLFILFLIIFLIYNRIKKKDYQITYQIGNYQVSENYNKEKNDYTFLIQTEDNTYYTFLTDKHFWNKELINNVLEYKTDDTTCLKVESSKVSFPFICIKNNEQISYHLVSDEMKNKLGESTNQESREIIDTYSNINVYTFLNSTYYIFNYRGFYRINNKTKENISLFQKDIYTPALVTKANNKIFVPDYNQDYYFNKAYIIDMKTGKSEEWQLDHDIYLDSSILGVYQNEIYLIDKHDKTEWKFNLDKKQMSKIGNEDKGGIIYQNGLINVTMNKLLYQDCSFTNINTINYQMNNGLYQNMGNYRELINSDNSITIESMEKDHVYYILKDKLYVYDEKNGSQLLLNYFEWNFNKTNMIFVYHN